MSRIRTIKPEFWVDEKVGSLSLRARLLFIATWNFADDMGTVRGSAAFLRGQAFPYDDVTLVEMTSCVDELVASGLVRAFMDSGQVYLSIHYFRRHQKISNPSGAKYPDPPVALWESSMSPPVVVTEGYNEEGKGREGKGAVSNQNPRVRVLKSGGEA